MEELTDAEIELLDRAEEHLAEHGPLRIAELAAALDVGVDDLDELLMMTDNATTFVDGGRWYHVEAHLVGATVTHRFSPEEIATGRIEATADLWLLDVIEDRDVPLAAGGALHVDYDDLSYAGPDDWLRQVEPGGLIALRWDGSAVNVEVLDAAAIEDGEDALVPLVRLAFEEHRRERDYEMEIIELGYQLLADNAELLRQPRRPFSDTLAEAGIVVDGGFLYERGEDPLVRLRDQIERRVRAEGPWLDDELVDGVVAFALALSPRAEELDAGGAKELNARLADGQVTKAAADEGLGTRPYRLDEVRQLLDRIEQSLGPGDLAAGAWWLRSRIAEHDRDAAAWREHVEAALRVDPDFGPALEDRADLREEVGDAPGALRLLRRAGVRDDDPQVQRLGFYAQPGPATAGRNEPCGCGSGRKHKGCCGPTRGWPLRQRLDWLLQRLATFAHRPAQRLPIVELAEVFAFDEDSERHVQAVGDPLILALAVFDGGIVSSYLDLRGDLLRDDERDVVRGWCEVRLDAYEVTTIERPRLRMTSVRGGDDVEVDDASMAEHAEPGMTVATWLLPFPNGHFMGYAAQPVPELFLDGLIEVIEEGEPIGIAAFFEGQDHLHRLVEERRED